MARELELTRLKLKDDFEFYSRNCLNVRSKSGEIAPLHLNKAQRFIHNCIEKQRADTGQVRAIILKAGNKAYRHTLRADSTGRQRTGMASGLLS